MTSYAALIDAIYARHAPCPGSLRPIDSAAGRFVTCANCGKTIAVRWGRASRHVGKARTEEASER